MLDSLNTTLFLWLNAPATPNPVIFVIARVSAAWAIYAIALLMVLLWIRGGMAMRNRLFFAGLSAALGLSVNLTISSLYYHPRPFEIGLGHQFLAHAVDGSFPSDHGTVLFAIAFSMLLAGGEKFWSVIALLAALATAWGRVYLGVHWPFDMAGSALIAIIVAMLLQVGKRAGLLVISEKVISYYDVMLNLSHLPARLFPRSVGGRKR
jgi:undecaprenyl-diphosphatase